MYLTWKRDILGPHIAEICTPFPVICSNVNNTMQPKGKSKSKAVPFQAWTSPEGYRSLRLADSMTIGT